MSCKEKMQKKYYIYCGEDKKENYIRKLEKYFIYTSSAMQDATVIVPIHKISVASCIADDV